MKKIFLIFSTILLLPLSIMAYFFVCGYTIDEQSLKMYIISHNEYQKELNIPGVIDATMSLNDVDISIGKNIANKIDLKMEMKLIVNSLFLSKGGETDLILAVQLTPYLDVEKKKIYLTGLEITDINIAQEPVNKTLKLMLPYLKRSLTDYFNTHPVYALSKKDNILIEILQNQLKSLAIAPGALTLRFI